VASVPGCDSSDRLSVVPGFVSRRESLSPVNLAVVNVSLLVLPTFLVFSLLFFFRSRPGPLVGVLSLVSTETLLSLSVGIIWLTSLLMALVPASKTVYYNVVRPARSAAAAVEDREMYKNKKKANSQTQIVNCSSQ
jgi:hypothetical protein